MTLKCLIHVLLPYFVPINHLSHNMFETFKLLINGAHSQKYTFVPIEIICTIKSRLTCKQYS